MAFLPLSLIVCPSVKLGSCSTKLILLLWCSEVQPDICHSATPAQTLHHFDLTPAIARASHFHFTAQDFSNNKISLTSSIFLVCVLHSAQPHSSHVFTTIKPKQTHVFIFKLFIRGMKTLPSWREHHSYNHPFECCAWLWLAATLHPPSQSSVSGSAASWRTGCSDGWKIQNIFHPDCNFNSMRAYFATNKQKNVTLHHS